MKSDRKTAGNSSSKPRSAFVLKSNVRFARSAADIIQCVRDAIHERMLPTGVSLPTVRDLAAEIGVNRNTVSSAYRQLADAGMIRTEGRRGTIVVDSFRPLPPSDVLPVSVCNLSSGNPDPFLLPDINSYLADMRHDRFLYGDPLKLPDLVKIAGRRFAEDGLESGEFTVTSGTLDALERALIARLAPGDAVAVEEPCSPGTLYLLNALRLVAVPIPVDDEGMRADLLEKALRTTLRALIVTPRAHNPTGASISNERGKQLRRLVARFPELLVIEDDYFNGLARSSPLWIGNERRANWLVIRSLSKIFGPDLRIALLIGDSETIRLIEGRQQLGQRWVSSILQRLACCLLSDKATARLLKHASSVYAHRRETLVQALHRLRLDAMGADGLNVWLATSYDQQITQSLFARGWFVKSGGMLSNRQATGLRISIGQFPENKLDDFIRDMADCINKTGNSVGT